MINSSLTAPKTLSGSLNQNAMNLIRKLLMTSKAKRKTLPTGKIVIDDKSYTMGQIHSGNDKKLLDVFDFMQKSFKTEELPTFEALKQRVDGKSSGGNKIPKYRCFYIQENDKILGIRLSETFPMKNLSGKPTNKNIYYGLYIAVLDTHQGLGLAKELFIASLVDAVMLSDQEQREISTLIAECTQASEPLMNSLGLKKVFFEADNNLVELNYFQPALEFNFHTGENCKSEIAEHFMMKSLDRNIVSKGHLCEIIHSLFELYTENHNRQSFSNDAAHMECQKYFRNLRKNIFKQIIYESSHLRLLRAKEQQNATKENFIISKHFIADQR